MQIKTTMKYYYTPFRVTKMKKIDHTKCWWYEGPETLICCWWEVKCCNVLENSLMVSYKVKWTLTMWSSQSTASYLPKRKESMCPHKDLYTIAYSSFVCNSPCLKTTQYLLADEQVCHDGCIHTMDYYSVIKGNELFKKKTVWLLKLIISSLVADI